MSPLPSLDKKSTAEQIAAVPLTGRPLLLCDVDEVVLEFMIPLERHMADEGYSFRYDSYALTGNIRLSGSGALASPEEVKGLITGFFAQHTKSQPAVPHAADQLNRLSDLVDIVMLTNMPSEFHAQRQDCLQNHGMPYPIVTNRGPKGPAVHAFGQRTNQPILFIDDSPSNLTSVQSMVPDVGLAHFIAHRTLLEVAPDIDGILIKTGDWRDLGTCLTTWLATRKPLFL